ncbi:hypothetical protein [Paenibacillus apiarius]|uniref:hypothetical protein n=1 Tax=Paenibacillus apiarius TaxID=46240 RepID=UPI00197F9B18|nr:hypothetical protein [Paenibacillus apiarius]MBN3526119.1 hypothetical protein [Paenibacillus apiarius]
MQHLQVRDRALAERMVHPDSDVMFAGILAGEHPGEVWVTCQNRSWRSYGLTGLAAFI